MKSKMNIKSIVMMAAVGLISLFFINMSLAANTGKISVETANLRETADENAKILELLSMDETIEVIEKTGNWYKVKAKGMTGYVREDLLTVSGEIKTNYETTKNEVEQKEEQPTQENKEDEQTETKDDIELGKQKIAEDTTLKIVPVINATDTIEVKKDEEVNVIEVINGWVCVETKITKGWIRKEKIKKEETIVEQPTPQTVIKTLYVNSTSINLRKEANTTSEILANLPINTAVDVLAEANGWSQVKVNGKEGYISSSLLSTRKQETTRSAGTPRTASTTKTKKQETTQIVQQTMQTEPASGRGAEVVAYAQQFIGTKYTYGGSTPATGFDCSGFTSYVYRNFGINLPRTTGGQSGVGTPVSRNNLVAGDLVLYSGHVAIYVGGGQVIHSPRTGKTVCIVPINYAASNYIGARRVI